MSYALEIGVTLAVLSVLITIVFLTVNIGHGVRADSYEEAVRISSDLEDGNLFSLIGKENNMPTAAAYSLLRANGRLIPEFVCNITDKCKDSKDLTQDSICLRNHMRGRVSLEVEMVNDSWYKVTVHKENCPWYYTSCTCN